MTNQIYPYSLRCHLSAWRTHAKQPIGSPPGPRPQALVTPTPAHHIYCPRPAPQVHLTTHLTTCLPTLTPTPHQVMNEDGEVLALKMHRLGRTSFRAVKSKRDYLGRRQNFSWLYLSRLAALKEYAFMRALGDHGFPVPQAVDNNRWVGRVLLAGVCCWWSVLKHYMARCLHLYEPCCGMMQPVAATALHKQHASTKQLCADPHSTPCATTPLPSPPPALAPPSHPTPSRARRHAVLMTMMDARPLVQLRELDDPAPVYLAAMDLIGRLAAKGLIHCDFNEFNLLINEQEELTLIDFPQMVSVSHANAKELFERDVECVLRFFNKKIGYMPQQDNSLPYVRPVFEEVAAAAADGLDVELAASGFQRQHQQVLEDFAAAEAGSGDEDEEEGGSEEGSGGEEEEEGSAGEEQEEEGEEEDGQQRGGSRAAAQRSRLAGLSLRDSSGQQQAEGSGAESGGEDEASGSEEGEEGSGEEGDEEQRSSRRGSSRQQAAAAPATADRLLVQQRLNQQVKRAGKQAAFAKASRNATKPKTKKSKAAAAAMTGW